MGEFSSIDPTLHGAELSAHDQEMVATTEKTRLTPEDHIPVDMIPAGKMLLRKADPIIGPDNSFSSVIRVLDEEGGVADIETVAQKAELSEEEVIAVDIDNIIYPLFDHNGKDIMFSPAITAVKKDRAASNHDPIPVFDRNTLQAHAVAGD